MPRRRDEKSAAPSPSPRLSRRRAAEAAQAQAAASVPPVSESESEVDLPESAQEENGNAEEEEATEEVAAEEEEVEEAEGAEGAEDAKKPTMQDRQAKLRELRLRMNQSTAANRRDLIADHQKSKVTAKELQRLEKQRKLAQTLRTKAEAAENGEDLERRNAWKWSIEQNDRWEKKQAASRERNDETYNDEQHTAHKRYDKAVRNTKVDLVGYSRQKEKALGLAPGTLVPLGTSSDQLAAAGPSKSAEEDLYRDRDTLAYGDSKPSEDAIDRVIGKINKDMGGRKKKKRDDADEEVNYINKRNKVFNKKASRYFDKYTTEIRANLERGTAL